MAIGKCVTLFKVRNGRLVLRASLSIRILREDRTRKHLRHTVYSIMARALSPGWRLIGSGHVMDVVGGRQRFDLIGF